MKKAQRMAKKKNSRSGNRPNKPAKTLTEKKDRKKPGRDLIAGTRHGEGKQWQFRFDKTPQNEVIEDMFWCRSKEDFERLSGFYFDSELPWSNSRTGIVENVLITIGKRIEFHSRHGMLANKGADNVSISSGLEHRNSPGTNGLLSHESEPKADG